MTKVGFAEVSRKGSHVKLRNDSGRTVIVPDHRELARGTLASILRQAGIGVDEFVDLLWAVVSTIRYGPPHVGFLGRFGWCLPPQGVHEGVHGGCADAAIGGFVELGRADFSDREVPPLRLTANRKVAV